MKRVLRRLLVPLLLIVPLAGCVPGTWCVPLGEDPQGICLN